MVATGAGPPARSRSSPAVPSACEVPSRLRGSAGTPPPPDARAEASRAAPASAWATPASSATRLPTLPAARRAALLLCPAPRALPGSTCFTPSHRPALGFHSSDPRTAPPRPANLLPTALTTVAPFSLFNKAHHSSLAGACSLLLGIGRQAAAPQATATANPAPLYHVYLLGE